MARTSFTFSISEEMTATLAPVIDEAMRAFALDVFYGTAIITAGRKAVLRKNKSAARTEIVTASVVAA